MKASCAHLKLQDYLEGESRFIVARHYYRTETGAPLHDHDFAECFWITRGKCRHVYEDGEEILLAGEVRFVRPSHVHFIEHIGTQALRLTNIAFPAVILDTWEADYPVLRGHFFWTGTPHPGGIKIEPNHIEELEEQAHRLAVRTEDLFFLHRFLLDLFHNVLPPASDTRDLPAWMKQGLAALENQEIFSEGVPAFARACGRSPEHVARWCRKHLGKTPGELVNEARIKDAARQLRMTDNDILNIMYDCGLSNPSHFYKLFKQRYGLTPRAYRVQRHRVV